MKSYSVELLGSLIDNVTEGILVCSDDNKIQYANKSAEELFGYESDFLIGKDLFILIPQRFRHNHDQHVEKYFEKPANRKMGIGKSLYGLRRSGEEFPLEISLSYFHHDGSSFVFAFVVDITERKAIDIQLIEKNSSLEKMTEELAKLTSELESKVHERTMILREALEELEKSQKE
ncbi:MAG: PAS domain S-box protein, partial [Saprospiraceae bacterium]|nr:PAS domain S-box protein [Saprospiraceae bacterium]